MKLWKKISALRYLELMIFLVPLLISRRAVGRPLLAIKGPMTSSEASQGLLAGDETLAPKLLEKWGKLAVKASKIYPTIKPAFILAVIHAESRGNKNAVSHAGAEGLMQLMPVTQQSFGVSDPFDAWDNVEGGTHVLSFLANRYHVDFNKDSDVVGMMVAYNWGYGYYDKALKGTKTPPKKSVGYANRVLALFRLYKKIGG